jgi:type II secretory pathway pseudopilin PulG
MAWMALPIVSGRDAERGFTLASLIVLLTIMMIFVAYTVPRQWSTIVQRDREMQTIFIMKQYAKAIDAFQIRNRVPPVSISQLKDARQPRFLRGNGEPIDPLTGEADWLVIPQAAAGAPTGRTAPGAPQVTTTPQGVPMKDYAGGPFIGIRPGKNGNSLIELNGKSKYEEWTYNLSDYTAERNARLASAAKVWQ